MAADSGDTSWAQGPFGDDAWDVELDEAFVNAARVKEQSARARSMAAAWSGQPPPVAGWRAAADRPRRHRLLRSRRTLRILAVGVVAAIGIAVGAHALSSDGTGGSAGPSIFGPAGSAGTDVGDLARPPGAPVQGGSATDGYPDGTVSAESGVPAVSPSLPAGDDGRAVITMPVAFPRVVQDPVDGGYYTRIGFRAADGCTDAALISSALAEQIELQSGCRGLSFVLYADSSGNLYTIAMLTMNSSADSYALIQWCVANLSSDQIGALIPGPESGLQVLRRTSGATQTYAASGRILTMGLAQWSDGHNGDVQQLQSLFDPLFGTISGRASDYEGGQAMVPVTG